MKERPILFNGDMVRAILDGRKTQTRRVVKPQPPQHTIAYEKGILIQEGTRLAPMRFCPYGEVGNRLWVRETWGTIPEHDHVKPSDFKPHGVKIYYRAENEQVTWRVDRWRPSIHMPRWASRITLAVTGVRVERVQDISPFDGLKEGYPDIAEDGDIVLWFAQLWDSINKSRGYGWNTNPFVWVVSFEVADA